MDFFRVNGAPLNSSTRNSGMRRSKFELNSSQNQSFQSNKNLIKKFETQSSLEFQNGTTGKLSPKQLIGNKSPIQNEDWRKNAEEKLAQELAFNLGLNNNNSIIKQQRINEGIPPNRSFQNSAAAEISPASDEGKENIQVIAINKTLIDLDVFYF